MHDHKSISLESHLARLPLFSGIAIDDIERIASSSKFIHAQKGEVIFHAGDACIGFHLIVSGQVKLAFSSPQGTEKIVEIVRQGESIDEATMFLDKTYIVFAQALQHSMLIHIPKAAILSELEQDCVFTKRMLDGLAKRTYDLMTDVEAYSLQSARQRTIGYLINELPQAAMESYPDELEFELSTGKGVIASRLNITQEHFSRVLHDLSESGLIETRGKKVRIPSLSTLLESQDNP